MITWIESGLTQAHKRKCNAYMRQVMHWDNGISVIRRAQEPGACLLTWVKCSLVLLGRNKAAFDGTIIVYVASQASRLDRRKNAVKMLQCWMHACIHLRNYRRYLDKVRYIFTLRP